VWDSEIRFFIGESKARRARDTPLSHKRKTATGPVSRGPSGKALNLDNLAKRVLAPVLEGAEIEWYGWYSLRRGVATTLASLSRDPLASKGLLRHSSLATTQKHYIKDLPENTLQAMNGWNNCSTIVERRGN